MILASLILLSGPLSPAAQESSTPDLVAIKARRVLVGDGTEIEHAVILVDKGRIVTMGQDLPIERGIPVIELDKDHVVMPGLVNPYSRYGLSGGGYNDSRPHVMASAELDPSAAFGPALEAGVTTLGLYPAGTGIPGQAVAVRTKGQSDAEMILKDGAYLKMVMRPSPSNKRNLRKAFEDVAKYREKVEKEREKHEKKNKPAAKSGKDEEKPADKEGEKEGEKKPASSSSKKKEEPFVPPPPDAEVKPFLDLLEGRLRALVTIDSAAGFDHFIDVLESQAAAVEAAGAGDAKAAEAGADKEGEAKDEGKDEAKDDAAAKDAKPGERKPFEWHLRIGLSRDIDVFYVKDKIGATGCFVLTDPEITLHPGTMRQRNLPAEFDRAGARVILLPRGDDARSFERWLEDVAVMVGAGLDRKAAIRAVTQYPAEFLGLGAELGTVAEGKAANLLILSGDPFDAGTRVEAVMLDGQIVHGETKL